MRFLKTSQLKINKNVPNNSYDKLKKLGATNISTTDRIVPFSMFLYRNTNCVPNSIADIIVAVTLSHLLPVHICSLRMHKLHY